MKRGLLRLLLLAGVLAPASAAPPTAAARPNFLWIIAEDLGPSLGCYGDPIVRSPRLDALAAGGIRFTNTWAGGPACSPSRSSLFTGLPATALGTDTHRAERPVPPWAFFTTYLLQAGYHCTNNGKNDYNISNLPAAAWDADAGDATYLTRAPGQPFSHLFPPDLQPGSISNRLIGFLDFAPTLFSLAGVSAPSYLAADPAHADRLVRLRDRLHAWLDTSGDIAFTPDPLRSPREFPTYHDRLHTAPALRRAILGPRTAPLDEKLTALHSRQPADFRLRSALVTRGLLPAGQLFP